jgi:hypothetical protein
MQARRLLSTPRRCLVRTIPYERLDASKTGVMATAVDWFGHRIQQKKLGVEDPELAVFLHGLPGDKMRRPRGMQRLGARLRRGILDRSPRPLGSSAEDPTHHRSDAQDRHRGLGGVGQAGSPRRGRRGVRPVPGAEGPSPPNAGEGVLPEEVEGCHQSHLRSLPQEGIAYEENTLARKRGREELRSYESPR